MGKWLHMAWLSMPIYGLAKLRSCYLRRSKLVRACAARERNLAVTHGRMQLTPQNGDYSLTSPMAIIDIADAQCRTAIA